VCLSVHVVDFNIVLKVNTVEYNEYTIYMKYSIHSMCLRNYVSNLSIRVYTLDVPLFGCSF
jgi:hypothetical protein